ncbi:MAG: AMP-binding protein [Ilumatobacteraceae bacterium]|nr:AMP-binding protein [Ilumatobacteraceae bacterium]
MNDTASAGQSTALPAAEGPYRSMAEAVEEWVVAEPDRIAIVDADGEEVDYRTFGARSGALAADLIDRLSGPGARVGVYMRNCSAFLETYIGASAGSMTPFNINFRYTAPEIAYLLGNADAEAVVVHREFQSVLRDALVDSPSVRVVYVVDDGTEPIDHPTADDAGAAEWVDYRSVRSADRTVEGRGNGDDLMFLYTGGTTGMPKAAMWRQGDLVKLYTGTMRALAAQSDLGDVQLTTLTVAPLMHGTGLISQLSNLFDGGKVVITGAHRFVASDVIDLLERYRVHVLTLVGDPFAAPLRDALDADPDRDLGSLAVISSSGAMWSQPVKEGLLEHLPDVTLYDSFASSEAMGLGASVTRRSAAATTTATFALGDRANVLADDGSWVEPGSGVPGRIAVREPVPIGYFKDAKKSAETFVEVGGVRYSVPGDYVMVEHDGSLTLLGRGSSCINTGGEKVYPEEIEETLKLHDAVEDAACLGLPDERFGETVCAVVQVRPGASPTADELIEHCRSRLARYKAPRTIVLVDDLMRAPNGKLDRPSLKALAIERAS